MDSGGLGEADDVPKASQCHYRGRAFRFWETHDHGAFDQVGGPYMLPSGEGPSGESRWFQVDLEAREILQVSVVSVTQPADQQALPSGQVQITEVEDSDVQSEAYGDRE